MSRLIRAAVYQCIYETLERQGLPPTVAEIASACQLTAAAAERALAQLEVRRQIVRLPDKPRGIRLTEMDRRWWVEEQVYRYLRRYSQQWGCLPSLQHIAQDCGLGMKTARDHVQHLTASGRLNGLSVGGLAAFFIPTKQSA